MVQAKDPYEDGDKVVFRSTRRRPALVRRAHATPPPDVGADTGETPGGLLPQIVTPIDTAHAAMNGGGAAEHRAFIETVAAAELLVLLEGEIGAGRPVARVVPVEGAKYVLAFDTDDRAVALAGEDAPISLVDGRGLFNLIAGRGVGVAVNLGHAPSTALIAAEEIDRYLDAARAAEASAAPEPAAEKTAEPDSPTETPPPGTTHAGQSGAPEPPEDGPDAPAAEPEDPTAFVNASGFRALLAPNGFPDSLMAALGQAMGRIDGLCDRALLMRAEYVDGKSGYILGFSGVAAAGRAGIERAVAEAAAAARRRDVALDVAFFAADEPALDRIARVAVTLKPAPAASRS